MTQIEYQSYTVLNFVENWINKETRSDNLENKELVHEFNKFFSYFVAFNALYNEVYFQETGKTVGMGDNKRAMDAVITFLGDTELKNALGRADAEIGFIKKVIDDNIFRFHFNEKTINKVKMNGQQLDAYYRNNLNDNCTSYKYCEAVFSFLYQVRCNMFHGSKGFEPNQKKLIQSMNVILEVLIEFLKEELSSNNLRTSFRRTQ
jgi:hypothetical protein